MRSELTTGICFPERDAARNESDFRTLLEDVASCVAKHLGEGGYCSAIAAQNLLKEYQNSLTRLPLHAGPVLDFIFFVAESQAPHHGLTLEGETARIQKILRWRLSDRVRCWTFGALPGSSEKLYTRSDSLRSACFRLGCPTMMSEEGSIVHVTSINPVAALVASAWITQELADLAQGEAPFAFPLMVDLPLWLSMSQHHFKSL